MKSCSVFLLLILAVIAGLGLGLLFGWVIWPVQWTDANPENLRIEFQTDWMNMAIDSYSVNQNADLAAQRYSYLGADGPVVLNAIAADPVWVSEADALAYQQAVTGASAAAPVPVPVATETSVASRILKPPLLGYVLVVLFLALLAIILLVILVFRLLGGDKKKAQEPAAAIVAAEELGQPTPEGETPTTEVVEPVVEDESRSGIGAAAVAGAAVAAIASDNDETEIAPEITEEAGPMDDTQEVVPPELAAVEVAAAEQETGDGLSAGVLAAGAAVAAGIAVAASSDSEEEPTAEEAVSVTAGETVDAEPIEVPGELDAQGMGLGGAAAVGAAVAGVDWALEEPAEEAIAEKIDVVEADQDWQPEDSGSEPSGDFYGKYNRKVIDVEGIGEVYAQKLADAGITTTHALLQQCATRKGREDLAEKTGISAKLILQWANHADMMRIQGIGPQWSDLLEMVGVNTVREMALRNPANLHQSMVDVNAEKKLVRQLPTPTQVEDWIEQAKELPRILSY